MPFFPWWDSYDRLSLFNNPKCRKSRRLENLKWLRMAKTLRVDNSEGSQEGGHVFSFTLIGFSKMRDAPLKGGPKNLIGLK